MIDPGTPKVEINEIRGAFTSYLDQQDIPPGRSLIANNAEFRQGQMRTRLGFATAFSGNAACISLFNWISGLGSYLLSYQPGSGIYIANIASAPAWAPIIGASAATVKFTNAGARVYVALSDTDQAGSQEGHVISYQSAAFVIDEIMPGPSTYAPGSPTEPVGTGFVTKGAHNFGYVVEYRSGFKGRFNPDSGVGTPSLSTIVPKAFTTAGSKKVEWILNTTWPTGAVRVYGLMTPASNPAQWFFVPGAEQAVTGGSPSSITLTYDISDEYLWDNIADLDASDHVIMQTQTTGGTAPWLPAFCEVFGDRMVYLTTTNDTNGNRVGTLLISGNRHEYQKILLNRSLVQLPGQRNLTTFAVVGKMILACGPNYSYAISDNGADPVGWSIDPLNDKVGTPAIQGIGIDTESSTGWIADKEGLFQFSGSGIETMPISYYQTDQWKRINWNYPYFVKVVADGGRRRVYVMAPLDSATTPSHIFVWDYTRGRSSAKSDFSLWNFSGYNLAAIAMVQNDLSGAVTAAAKRMELWLGSSDSATVMRQKVATDTTPYRDGAAGIAFRCKLAPTPPGSSQFHLHLGAKVRATGSGTLAGTQYTKDDVASVALPSLTLAATQESEAFLGGGAVAESVSYDFQQSAADSNVALSGVTAYHVPYATM